MHIYNVYIKPYSHQLSCNVFVVYIVTNRIVGTCMYLSSSFVYMFCILDWGLSFSLISARSLGRERVWYCVSLGRQRVFR